MTTQIQTPASARRDAVQREYDERIERGAGTTAGISAGYDAAQQGVLPADVQALSFGCGNPVAFSGVAPGHTVVDLGSGAGLDLVCAAQRTGPTGRVIGVDMTEAMNARARAHIAAAGLSDVVEVREGIIEALPVETASADWVVSNCVVNLSPEKDRVFAEVFRVLKPGGRMLISDIVMDGVPRVARWVVGRYNATAAAALGEQAYLDGLHAAGMHGAEVRLRTGYDRATIAALIDDEMTIPTGRGPIQTLRRWGLNGLIAVMSRVGAGKVQSVYVYAEKPR